MRPRHEHRRRQCLFGGRTFHDLDDFFCTKGHEFLQEIYQQKLQEKITAIEQTDEGKQCPHCKKKRTSKTRRRKGETEFYADGVFVHIRNAEDIAQWMEMKVGAFAKRERGESALPSERHIRILPEPSVVSAFASIAKGVRS